MQASLLLEVVATKQNPLLSGRVFHLNDKKHQYLTSMHDVPLRISRSFACMVKALFCLESLLGGSITTQRNKEKSKEKYTKRLLTLFVASRPPISIPPVNFTINNFCTE